MKKRFMLTVLALLLVTLPACAPAEEISGCGITADTRDTALDFGDIRITEEDVDALVALLDQMPNLEKVDMYESLLPSEATDRLFDRYPDITFGWTFRIVDHTLRTDATAFSTLHGSSPKPPHTGEDFKKLRYCKNLQALDVGHNWIEDLSFLRDLPHLKVLILGRNQIKDITPVAQLQELEYLELFSNHIRDITPLTELKNLRDLNVKNNPIEDLSPLMEMTWLERLWLGMNIEVTRAQQAEFAQALPDCEIDWRSMPTDGTWRKHPHYFVIYDMFRSPDYVPFDD